MITKLIEIIPMAKTVKRREEVIVRHFNFQNRNITMIKILKLMIQCHQTINNYPKIQQLDQ